MEEALNVVQQHYAKGAVLNGLTFDRQLIREHAETSTQPNKETTLRLNEKNIVAFPGVPENFVCRFNVSGGGQETAANQKKLLQRGFLVYKNLTGETNAVVASEQSGAAVATVGNNSQALQEQQQQQRQQQQPQQETAIWKLLLPIAAGLLLLIVAAVVIYLALRDSGDSADESLLLLKQQQQFASFNAAPDNLGTFDPNVY